MHANGITVTVIKTMNGKEEITDSTSIKSIMLRKITEKNKYLMFPLISTVRRKKGKDQTKVNETLEI